MSAQPVDQAKLDKMLYFIRGLLSKTVENGASQQEAELAAAKAQDLAFRYNLDLAAAGNLKTGQAAGASVKSTPFDLRSNHTWKRELFYGICSCNFGRGIVWGHTRKAAVVGEPHNVQIIGYLYTYLERTTMALANEAWHKETDGRRYSTSHQGEGEGTYKDRFGRGVAAAVVSRLYGQRKTSQAENIGGTALTLVTEGLLKDKMAELHPDSYTKKKVKRVRPAASSWKQGVAAGQKIGLNAALDETEWKR